MERLTKHKDGTENVYTSPCKKQELVDRLGQYEDIAGIDDLKKLVEQKVGSGTPPESSDEIPGQMDIFQFLGGTV